MTQKFKCDVGGSIGYSTKPVGLTTYLFVQPWADDKNVVGDTTATWHIELCNQPDHAIPVTEDSGTIQTNISKAAGAIVSVRNTGGWPFWCWTDY